MDFDALTRVLGRDPGTREEPAPRAAVRPPGEPAAVALGNPITNPDTRAEAAREAREERSAILQYEGGLTREAADGEAARLHPDPSDDVLSL